VSTDFYIEFDPTNFYLVAGEGIPVSAILDETTMTGDTASVYYDDAISLTFIQVAADVTFGAYNDVGFDTGYAFVYWDVAVPLDSVEFSVTFYSQLATTPFTEITTFTARNTGDDVSITLLFPSPVSVPPGGGIRMDLTFEDISATETFGGELSLRWDQGRQWWVGVAGWGG
jgi:hypothetical protein